MVLKIEPIDWFRREFLCCCGSSSKVQFNLPSSTPMSSWGNLYQTATVGANTSEVLIFSYSVPETGRAFIRAWGNNMFENYNLKIVVDGEILENNIQRELGEVSNPTKMYVPLYVMNSFKVYATNTGAAAVTGEFFIDGEIYNYGEFLNCIGQDFGV